ncbi:DUF3604 domain-containing protein [Halieaceae bacterium IMCC14734]|uniref:DUF3604 domain-containing protein n=1 Tax=Candidatus Litorirhabdus singularis TaxID=2518993 RepID=A0ABT3TKR6_9GAMM|nr:DUF3604 domain-containing protein [Candidatus Litorirhabdus singularis]MCX2982932.1 DUF3604 domain-containing protein [Candidatus Litorirhabdus singularis]
MIFRTALSIAIALTAACSGDLSESDKREQAQEYFRTTNTIIPASDEIIAFPSAPAPDSGRPLPNPDRNAYFGDLHVHTTLSFDASAFGTTASPADAYRYAQGEAITHPSGFEVQLAQPLDFYAVTDHAVFLGLINEAADTSTSISQYDFAKPYHNINESVDGGLLDLSKRSKVFYGFVSDVVISLLDGVIDNAAVNNVSKSAWSQTVEAANAAYVPGTFTTFAAYEFTSSTAARESLHRNVIFRGTERLPALPFSRFNSLNPEGLWDWMDTLRQQDIESLAIPHNSNGSNGAMFMFTDWAGNAIDQEYADQRLRNEPLVEITQVKGTSDTHPLLSKNDEWANFEIFPLRTSTRIPSDPPGSYVRNAWQRGLAIEERDAGNPYKFGVIGSSDTHTGAASLAEDNYFGKIGSFDSSPEKRGSIPASFLYGTLVKLAASEMVEKVDGENYLNFSGYKYWGASGIAGVWAEENTREAIYDALRRKETFATSGTRIKVRFFAGYDFADAQLNSLDLVKGAYQSGTTMGGTLQANGDRQPTFLTWAVADPNTAQLQRVQIIKGWLENGEHQERVYDAACSDDMSVDPQTHRCPDNGARVDLDDCSITANVGASELKTLWQDPDFIPGQEAFYYVRVLENPVCRWSTWDALRAGEAPRSDLPATIQERAWSSPIWYSALSENNNFVD